MALPLLPSNKRVAISSCLAGIPCRYDGKASKNMKAYQNCFHFCPEVFGGLSIPRIPCQIDNGSGEDVLLGKAKVIGSDGKDYTKQFIHGAQEVVYALRDRGLKTVILKEKSPSCGVHKIYNNGVLIGGCGVTTALLKKHGIKVLSDSENGEDNE